MLCSRDFFNKSTYNNETKEQMWMSILSDSHDSICACNFPFAHLLSIIFPPGHTDRDRTINEILVRDFTEKCRGGGLAGDASGNQKETTTEEGAATGLKEEKEDSLAGEDVEHLLAAAIEDTNTR